MLEDLRPVKTDPKLSMITCNDKGREFYIENEFHSANGFRKLHIEVAEFSRSLKILHCVFFPDPMFDIPIFGMDLVKIKENVSAAIVDLSPVSEKNDSKYERYLADVDKSCFKSLRKIPDWGKIFSKHVLFASLQNESEKKEFSKIVDQYLLTLIKLSCNAKADLNDKNIKERINYQRNYCLQQMKNDKTSMVLLKYFDKEWVDDYIKNVLFDFL